MFDDRNKLISALRNPMVIAAAALNEIESRLGGDKIIADPNTPFCHLLEFGSSIASEVIQAMDNKLPTLYAKRAENMEDLYNHMSDFDYLRMYSTPAKSAIRMYFPKKYLIDNAITVNTNYKKLVFPADTVFLVSKYTFGIYYPINILINNYTNSFTVTYDTTEANPLHVLSKNIVDKYDLTYSGVDYLVLDFPVYQFAKSTITESLIAETGFTKSIIYNDDFYALRVFNYKNGSYTELAQTQSKIVYDINNPTIYLQILSDEKKIKIIVPQIYFDNNVMGSKLLIELYTTVGQLDITTTNIQGTGIGITYGENPRFDNRYSTIFKNMPYDNIVQLSGDKITGGSNAVSMDTLRERVVNDTLYSKVPITESELSVQLEDDGFYVKKYLDNITDRIYYAYKVIRDATGTVVPSLNLSVQVLSTYRTDEEHSLFVYYGADTSYTILPSQLYKYDTDQDCAIPLTNTEMNNLLALDKSELATTLNENKYLKSPYHLRVSLSDTYPRADTFDLLTPTVDKIIFEEDNYETSAKIMCMSATINHDNVGYYEVTLVVTKSDDFNTIDISDIKIKVVVESSSGKWLNADCTYVSTDTNTNNDIFKFTIPTTYHLTLDNEIGVTYRALDDDYTNPEYLLDLTTDFHLVFMVSRTALSGVSDPVDNIVKGVGDTDKAMYIGLSRQYLTLTLGTCLNHVIRNDVEVSLSKTEYAKYTVNIPAKYTEDVYERDDNGCIKTYIDDNGNMSTNKIHEVGEIIYNESGNEVYEHQIGDFKRDNQGNLISVTDGTTMYFINMMFIDAKIFFSDRQAELNFQKNIYESLNGYFDVITNLQDQLLERTKLFFKCVRSTGMTRVNLGDGIISKQDIELSFRIVCYVPSYVKQSESIQNEITEMVATAIESAIDSKVVSMLDIFEEVKNKMDDYIDHFDLLGINDSINLQTFIAIDEDSQPSIRRDLVLSNDNILSLQKKLDITFVALSSNSDSTTYSA
jgi:hypothetical protein